MRYKGPAIYFATIANYHYTDRETCPGVGNDDVSYTWISISKVSHETREHAKSSLVFTILSPSQTPI